MRAGALAALGTAILLAAPASAAAKIDAADVRAASLVIADVPVVDVPGPGSGTAGGYVSCPPGTKIFTGGAYLYPSGQPEKPAAILFSNVTSSTPTSDGNGWYADASNGTATPLTLRTLLRCLPAQKLADVRLAQATNAVGVGQVDGGTARCRKSERAITGGTFWHVAGEGPSHPLANDAWVGSSGPVGNARGWYGDGKTSAALEITSYAHCLPRARLSGYRVQLVDTRIPPGDQRVRKGSCPRSHPAVGAAGAYFHEPGKAPRRANAHEAFLMSGGVLEGSRRFSAAGRQISNSGLRLATRGFCVAR